MFAIRFQRAIEFSKHGEFILHVSIWMTMRIKHRMGGFVLMMMPTFITFSNDISSSLAALRIVWRSAQRKKKEINALEKKNNNIGQFRLERERETTRRNKRFRSMYTTHALIVWKTKSTLTFFYDHVNRIVFTLRPRFRIKLLKFMKPNKASGEQQEQHTHNHNHALLILMVVGVFFLCVSFLSIAKNYSLISHALWVHAHVNEKTDVDLDLRLNGNGEKMAHKIIEMSQFMAAFQHKTTMRL